MKYCSKCGSMIGEGEKFCAACGNPAPKDRNADPVRPNQFTDTPDHSINYTAADICRNKGMAVLCYLGILLLIPYIMRKDSPYVRYHLNQGLVLLLVNVGYGILSGVITSLIHLTLVANLLSLGNLLILVLTVMGILNAVNGRAKELPVIGSYQIFS